MASIMTYFYKGSLGVVEQSPYHNRQRMIELEKSFYTGTSCREGITGVLRETSVFTNEYEFIIQIKPRTMSCMKVVNEISDVFGMSLSFTPVNDRILIMGKTKDFQNFNYGISFLLYVMKYCNNISWVLNKEVISTKRLHYSGYNQDVEVFTGFLWYLYYVKKISDLDIPAQDTNANGAANFVKGWLFTLYPKLYPLFKEYVNALEGSVKFRVNYRSTRINVRKTYKTLGGL